MGVVIITVEDGRLCTDSHAVSLKSSQWVQGPGLSVPLVLESSVPLVFGSYPVAVEFVAVLVARSAGPALVPAPTTLKGREDSWML